MKNPIARKLPPRDKSTVLCLFLAVLLAFSSFVGCQNQPTVLVRAWAAQDYRANVNAPGNDQSFMPPAPEKYILVRGRFEGGNTRDDSLKGESQFLFICKWLKEALLKQNYQMIGLDELPDLLIVVHWGLTAIDTDTIHLDDFEGTTEFYDRPTDYSLRRTALLIGTADQLYGRKADKLGNWEKERALVETLDERYYFVCIAYDWEGLVRKEKIVRFVTQFSINSLGMNFDEALPYMTKVAADFFGRNSSELHFDDAQLKEDIRLGPLQILDAEEPPAKNTTTPGGNK